MESNPPLFYFIGINFNPSFYTACLFSDGGISKTFADSTYIRKAGDTTTGIINFPVSILCSDIKPTNTAQTVALYDTLDAGGVLNILNKNTTSVLNINRPITLNYTYGSLNSSTQLGYCFSVTGSATTLTSSVASLLASAGAVTPGVYIYNFHVTLSITVSSATFSKIWLGFSPTGSIIDPVPGLVDVYEQSLAYATNDGPVFSSGGIYNNTTGANLSLIIFGTFTGTATVTATGITKYLRIG